jgi:prevent-host-death family protein
MRMIGLHEARQKFSELVRCAERGETIGITRYGKLIALIGPVEVAQSFVSKDSSRAETEAFQKAALRTFDRD